jgi:hypothetical protein
MSCYSEGSQGETLCAVELLEEECEEEEEDNVFQVRSHIAVTGDFLPQQGVLSGYQMAVLLDGLWSHRTVCVITVVLFYHEFIT